MNLSKHFTLAEATRSQTAARLRIDNTPSPAQLANMRLTADMMERIRAFLSDRAGRDIPIRVSSWLRVPALNAAVGSGSGSDHITGDAVDFEADGFGDPTAIAAALAPHVDALGIGQLINEFPDRNGWVHVSRLRPAKRVNRIITIKDSGTVVGIVR